MKETSHGKLIKFLLEQIDKSLDQISKGNPNAGLVELEYALHEADISLEDQPQLRSCFYEK